MAYSANRKAQAVQSSVQKADKLNNIYNSVNENGPLHKMSAHTAVADGTALTVTIAHILTGILVMDPTADKAWTLPTAALAVAGVAGCKVHDTLDFSIINTGSTGEDEIITLAAGTGGTLVGYGGVGTATVTHDAVEIGSGLFRLRFANVTAGSEAIVCYRLA